jgi:hypothetical protein
MGAGVVGMGNGVRYATGAAALPDGAERPGADIHSTALRFVRERRSGAGKQRALVAGGAETFDQPQYLPLSAAHFGSGIEMEDSH